MFTIGLIVNDNYSTDIRRVTAGLLREVRHVLWPPVQRPAGPGAGLWLARHEAALGGPCTAGHIEHLTELPAEIGPHHPSTGHQQTHHLLHVLDRVCGQWRRE